MPDNMFGLKERIASSDRFTDSEKLFLQEAVNLIAKTNGVVEPGNPTWKTIPAERVFEAGAKRCPTCGAAAL
jgi:hypothetical protein